MAEYKTIGQAAQELDVPDYVLRFWEKKFKVVHPSKRRGGRRYYSNEDIETLRKIKTLLHTSGYTIKGANILLNNKIIDINTQGKKDSMAASKKNAKQKQQPDLFGGEELSGDSKDKLRELIEQLRKAQELLQKAG